MTREPLVEPSRNALINHIPGGLYVVIPGWLGWAIALFELFGIYWVLWLDRREILDVFSGKSDFQTSVLLVVLGVAHATAIPLLIWQAIGREVIFIDGTTMTQRFELFGLGWARRWPMTEVRQLRVFSILRPDANTQWRPDMLQNSIKFLCAHKTYRMGLALRYEAALRLVHAICEAYPSACTDA